MSWQPSPGVPQVKNGVPNIPTKATVPHPIPVHLQAEDRRPGQDLVMDLGSVAPGFMMYSPNLDFIFAVRVAFVSATDSENSEDRSSESSTAASMPKVRYDMPAVLATFMRNTR
ncbi:hypothetical protein V6N11_067200 [Hibiscus sabdariffa]|uniref:Uncharacterized protein n=1 Tax=Hibiscus sabdariffa TaxID=183260 RepID=A0ABR2SQD2_9ROSI